MIINKSVVDRDYRAETLLGELIYFVREINRPRKLFISR